MHMITLRSFRDFFSDHCISQAACPTVSVEGLLAAPESESILGQSALQELTRRKHNNEDIRLLNPSGSLDLEMGQEAEVITLPHRG
jgi:hypothetical protein